MIKEQLPKEIERALMALRLEVAGSIVDSIRDIIIRTLNDDESEEQIAKEAAKNRVLGAAIQHYLQEKRVSGVTHCHLCTAVANFESKLAPGHLKMLGELYLQTESD